MTLSNKQTDLKQVQEDIHSYLWDYQHRELLRFVVVGSVDDGKSTLIGRLLHDTGQVFEDQLEDARRNSAGDEEEIDFSLLTDGLRAEREQGITIDVAYRYFSTARRKYIIADTPGHVQYTRNMATGASTADVAVILIDARLGVQQQSRRHAYIASLLGIRHLVVAVNKMDLVDFDEQAYQDIATEFDAFTDKLAFTDVYYFPVSAKQGDNVVEASSNTPWYDGTTLMEHLETVPIQSDRNFEDFRLPVQYVIRPHQDYRGFAGQMASGVLREGDPVMVLPSRRQSRVKAIDTYDGPIPEAFPPMSVTVRLEDEIDISRGDLLVHPNNQPHIDRHLDAILVWMSDKPLDPKGSYLLKHTTQTVRANVEEVLWKSDPNTLNELPTDLLELNDIGRVRWVCHRPLAYDPYPQNRSTGAFIVIDALTNETLAAGMLQEPSSRGASNDHKARSQRSILTPPYDDAQTWDAQPAPALTSQEREDLLGQRGAIVHFQGTAEADLHHLTRNLEQALLAQGAFVSTLTTDDTQLEAQITTLQAYTHAGLLVFLVAPNLSDDSLTLLQDTLGDDRVFAVTLHPNAPIPLNQRPANGVTAAPSEPFAANDDTTQHLDVYRTHHLPDVQQRIYAFLGAQGLLRFV